MKHVLLSELQLGQLLKSARKRMRLSQQALGERVGLSQARISQMEREPRTIAADQLLKLMGALKLELVVQDKLAAEPAGSSSGPSSGQSSGPSSPGGAILAREPHPEVDW